MSQMLTEIAQMLADADKKVQLIYAFNSMGKTRLSRAFKDLVAPKGEDKDAESQRFKILYYSAFTEDLFYWDNDLSDDTGPRLNIQPNAFTDWVLREQGQDQNIISNFQRYVGDKLTPHFNDDFSEVTFSLERGTDGHSGKLKISSGEESNFIWSIFYTLLDLVVSILNTPEDERDTDQFNELEYVFIDDPVSSLDESHLIKLAVTLAELIKSTPDHGPKFIITTHNPLFYNVVHSALNTKTCYWMERREDGTFCVEEKEGASNRSFSYHLYLKHLLEQAKAEDRIEKYHFMLLRNLYEKTASFLGYEHWSNLLPDDKQTYLKRIIQFTSHSNLSNEAVAEPTPQEKQTVKFLLDHLLKEYGYRRQENKND